ncbi:MAG: serine/threonine-protein kinase, partial [Sorangiineae bacterium]|nr:serine/threonine-protein kinase [Sorangiineae bacterium]
ARLAAGDAPGAARDFEAARAWLEAARAYQGAGEPRAAARCLEAAIAAGVSVDAARLALGALLARNGRDEAAVQALQRVATTAPERAAALGLLRELFERLGLGGARVEVDRELRERGVAASEAAALAARASSAEPRGSAPGRPDAPPRERWFGRYEVVREVAVTPTARVLEALDTLTGARVALKLFAGSSGGDAGRDALVKFAREAEILGRLRHPAIVALEGFYPEGPAVVLAWMAGGSLAELLERGPLAPARAAEITSAVLAALTEAHRRGILHRDLKPANVLFDEAGGPHLADFGTAHLSDLAATVTAGIIGTLAYMAPEQRAGAPATVASDLYGAGALFWHALTGGPPSAELPFLSSELEDSHRALARRLIGPPEERPDGAEAARALIAAVPWPARVPAARPAPVHDARETPLAPAAQTARLVPLGGARHRDTLLGRELYVLPADPATCARARAFARADHPALAAVLAMREREHTLWIDAPSTRSEGALGDAERARLRDALEALHRAGGVHGRVRSDHVARQGGAPVLLFPLAPLDATPEDDLSQLARLP